MQIDSEYNAKSVSLRVGEILELRLPENPTTGFRWRLEEHSGTTIVDDTLNAGAIPGQGGQRTLRFKMSAPGTYEIALRYQRRADIADQTAQSFRVSLQILP